MSLGKEARDMWFKRARFGMFIHWGIFSIPGRDVWLRSYEHLNKDNYEYFADKFEAKDFNPHAWANIAKQAGMKYAVMTAKHHDGFCMFDSGLTEFKSTCSPANRDFIRDFLREFRAAGLKVGLYYSLLDWHHEDYPAYNDRFHPMRGNPAWEEKVYNFDNYLKYMHGQVRELLTHYGTIDILWLDFAYDNMIGEKWKAADLTRMIRSLQPGILLNSRLESSGEAYGTILSDEPSEIAGDFTCPEMIIPSGSLKTPSGTDVPWESCFSINNSWGYNSIDRDFKSADMIIRKLVECVSKNGNVLLNIGPDPNGNIENQKNMILHEIGEWMKENGESIYGCGAADLPRPEWGRFTQRNQVLYAHVMEDVLGPLNIKGLGGKVQSARCLRDGTQIHIVSSWIANQYPEDLFLSYSPNSFATYLLPPSPDRVIRICLQ